MAKVDMLGTGDLPFQTLFSYLRREHNFPVPSATKTLLN